MNSAFVAAEDSDFFLHDGHNTTRVLGSIWAKWRDPESKLRGSSTITQQLAKVLLARLDAGTHRPNLNRQLREMFFVGQLEDAFGKDDLLCLYLDEIYLGQGAYGVRAAAWSHFRKKLGDLTVAEAAMLGGLPKRPSDYAPHRNPDSAAKRRGWVLQRMKETGAIDEATFVSASQEVLKAYPQPVAPQIPEELSDQGAD